MEDFLWGVDLGGTKIEGVVLQEQPDAAPQELARIRVPTEQEKGYAHVLSQISSLIDQLSTATKTNPTAIGFATPGVLDPVTRLLKNSNTACLRGQPLLADLQQRLGCDVVLANDANCFALSESRFGAARGKQCVFGVIMGTGVGGGIVVNGEARYGLQGIAGEFGHIVIDPRGPDCYCGQKGCVETLLSGPHLESFYEEQCGQKKSLADIISLAERDPAAMQTKQQMLAAFAHSIGTVINLLDPDIIVLGGGLSNLDCLYADGVRLVEKFVFNDSCATPIVSNLLGDSSGVYGAACLNASATTQLAS